MKSRFDLIVFDWDGTLMDSASKIVNCFRAAAIDVGVPSPSDDAIRHIIGLGLREALAILLPDHDDTTRARVTARYREHFVALDHTEMTLFPGVAAGLDRLTNQGQRLAIATGKARRGLDQVLAQTGLTRFFEVTRCADEARSKPHPQMLHDILSLTGVDPARALMVGDTIYDLQMAAAAVMPGLAVSYGVHSRALLLAEQPLACLDSFDEIHPWLS